MNRRDVTLVELMIVVAILGILTSAVGSATRQAQLTALSELHRERALLLLEYHADQLLLAQAPDPAVLERLTAALPKAAVLVERSSGVATLQATWEAPTGRSSTRSLTVLTP